MKILCPNLAPSTDDVWALWVSGIRLIGGLNNVRTVSKKTESRMKQISTYRVGVLWIWHDKYQEFSY